MMLCYKDMSFCAAPDCAVEDCHRNANYAINWEDVRRVGLGVAYTDFQLNCRWYEPLERKNQCEEEEESSDTIYGVTHW